MQKTYPLSRRSRIVAASLALLLAGGCAETQFVISGAKRLSGSAESTDSETTAGRYKVGDAYKIGDSWYYPKVDYNYVETGIASWYGPKFNGKRTANGEIFDQNLITAAHRTLPLPSLVRVTNLDNGRKMIVKINDRGPFHEGRIIDLSYAAAIRLGVDKTGTARIDVRALDVKTSKRSSAKLADGTFLQVGAFSKRRTADELAGKMVAAQLKPVSVKKSRGLYKVWIGPYASEAELEASSQRVVELGYERPHKVNR